MPGRSWQRKVQRAVRQGEDAVSTITGFAVALLMYGTAFAAFMTFTTGPQLAHDPGPSLGSEARGSAEALLSSAGSANWVSDPDHLTRFGLAKEGRPGLLDLDKLRALSRGEPGTNATNHQLDYGEAKAALGAGSDDFHLRTYPLVTPLAQAGLQPITGIRVAYVGDWSMQQQNGSSSYLVQYAPSVEERGDVVYVNVTITNNGTTAAVFQTTFTLPLAHSVVDTANTGLLAAGSGTEVVGMKLFKTAGWTWAGADRNVSVNIKDGTKTVASFKMDLGAYTMTAGSTAYALALASPEKLTYKTNQFPKISFDILDGAGSRVEDVAYRLNFTYLNGTLIASKSDETERENKWDAPKMPQAEYLVTLNRTANYGFSTWDRVYVTDADPGVFTPGPVFSYVESNASMAERRMVLDLVRGFKNTTYNVTGGDAYMDFSSVLNNDLAGNLTQNGQLFNFTALVIGSNVDHSALTSGAMTGAVRNYTLAGGLLVVLGSASQQMDWLQPLLQAAATTSGNGIASPDATNPVLHSPEELAYPTYVDSGLVWSFGSSDAAHFSHVLGVAGTTERDTLALSKPGHFGNGTVILAGWRPATLTQPQDNAEAERVLYNFLNYVRGSLYVDFGPTPPTYQAVASTTRVATAPDPIAPSSVLLVRMVLYTF
ncbi:MAG: hypothetical protein LC624_10110, partial [Halobacteriales archaeon]|nr:hypothetical protein [Halobacteriales archaeon]